MPDQARATAKTRARFAVAAFMMLALGGAALGFEIFESAAGTAAGFLLLPGALAVFLMTQQPPDPPAPVKEPS